MPSRSAEKSFYVTVTVDTISLSDSVSGIHDSNGPSGGGERGPYRSPSTCFFGLAVANISLGSAHGVQQSLAAIRLRQVYST